MFLRRNLHFFASCKRWSSIDLIKKDVGLNVFRLGSGLHATHHPRFVLHSIRHLTTTNSQGPTEFNYKKLKIDDPILTKYFLPVKSKNKKNENPYIITEGWRLTQEAIICNLKPKVIFFNKYENIKPILNLIKNQKNIEIYKIPQQTIRTWSTLTECPGLIAMFERKNNEDEGYTIIENKKSYPITVICDNIKEPNNLGSIIRTCAAIPCFKVIVMKGCCDPWGVKALRGGCGGQFRINIQSDVKWDNLDIILTENDVSVFIAESNLEKTKQYPLCSYTDVNLSNNHNYVIIGGETQGVSEDAYRFMFNGFNKSCIHIPLAEGVNSLNTSSALTVILFEMRKHLQLQYNQSEKEEINLIN